MQHNLTRLALQPKYALTLIFCGLARCRLDLRRVYGGILSDATA